MRRLLQYTVWGLGVTVATLCVVAGLESIAATASPRPQPATMTINRALKGDRLPVLPAPIKPVGLQDPAAQQHLPRLPEGCEAIVSTITRNALARTAGRCIS